MYNNDETEEDAEITTHEKRYISLEERQQIKSQEEHVLVMILNLKLQC